MSTVNVAANVTTNTTTTAVAVAQARSYTFAAVWGTGTVTITPEFSLNGTDFFSLTGSALTNIASGSTSVVYKIVDLPVSQIRITTTAISGGATVNATVAY